MAHGNDNMVAIVTIMMMSSFFSSLEFPDGFSQHLITQSRVRIHLNNLQRHRSDVYTLETSI